MKNIINIDIKNALFDCTDKEIDFSLDKIKNAHKAFLNNDFVGKKMTGWVKNAKSLLESSELNFIKEQAKKMSEMCKTMVILGVGGSFLGAYAGIKFLSHNKKSDNEIIFAGIDFSSYEIKTLLKKLEKTDFILNVISKSGTTLETVVYYKLLYNLLEKKHGKNAKDYVFYTTETDSKLYNIALAEKSVTFNIPKNIGGRYSVLTAVGLVPFCYMGIDIDLLLKSASSYVDRFFEAKDFSDITKAHETLQYAFIRNLRYNKGQKLELITSFEPCLEPLFMWYSQLFAESEGKDEKALFPTFAIFTRDLHSIGQYIQQGQKSILETFIKVKDNNEIKVPKFSYDILKFVDDLDIKTIQNSATLGVIKAHTLGKIPNIVLENIDLTEESLANLFMFFMLSCSLSALSLDVNPFDQPGVEDYKSQIRSQLNLEKE